MLKFKRTFEMEFYAGFVEIYEWLLCPKSEGQFWLVFRRKGSKKILPLEYGITAWGAKFMAKSFKELNFSQANLYSKIEEKSKTDNLVPL